MTADTIYKALRIQEKIDKYRLKICEFEATVDFEVVLCGFTLEADEIENIVIYLVTKYKKLLAEAEKELADL